MSAKMAASPTQLSLKHLRKTCDLVQVVEHWNPHCRIRQDLYGIIDILALSGAETVAVQSTTWGNVSARIKKMRESPNIDAIRKAGWKILVHGWRKNPLTKRYELKEIDIS
jgi:hypothetical protein